MRYIVIFNNEAFETNVYDYENNYNEGMIIIDLFKYEITFDGLNWNKIEQSLY